MDREKVINSIKACAHHPDHDCKSCDYCGDNFWCFNDQLIEDFETLLNEQPKTGEWIEKEDYNLDTYYDCSSCGESWITIDGTPWQNGMNYCPHCGAKMEKIQIKV